MTKFSNECAECEIGACQPAEDGPCMIRAEGGLAKFFLLSTLFHIFKFCKLLQSVSFGLVGFRYTDGLGTFNAKKSVKNARTNMRN